MLSNMPGSGEHVRFSDLVLIAALLLMVGGVSASDLATMSQGDIRFGIDTAVFSLMTGSDTLALEIYQEVETDQFARDSAGISLFTTEVFLLTADGDTSAVQMWNSEIERVPGRCVVNETIMPVVPGDYVLVVSMFDRGNGRQGTVRRNLGIEIPGTVSQIELARLVVPAQEESTNPLRKGGIIVYPAADSRFMLPDESIAYVYFELYNAGGMSLTRQSRLISPAGVTIFAKPWDVLQIPDGVSGAGILDSLDLSAARSTGLYRVHVSLAFDGDTVVVEKPLMISYEVAEGTVEAGSERTGERYLDQLVLLLSGQQQDIYDRLDDDGRALFYNEYWADNQSGMTAFEQRCAESSMFRYLNTEGWKTDRGRVYVIYGIPNDIEAVPMGLDQLPYEVWLYYEGGRNSFIFVDMSATGSFVQVFSTVEGEISFSNWEDYLVPLSGSAASSGSGLE